MVASDDHPRHYRSPHRFRASPKCLNRRTRLPAATYFFTVNLHDRRSDLLVTRIDTLRASVARVRRLMPFHIDAWVVLPDHMHALWTLPEGDEDFSRRWQAIKMAFSNAMTPGEPLSSSRRVRGERGIWQRRFWEHAIRDEQDYAAHVDYIHFNPVKHGLVADAAAWPHSTFRRAVAQGRYPSAWRPTVATTVPWANDDRRRSRRLSSGAMPKRIAPYDWRWCSARSQPSRAS